MSQELAVHTASTPAVKAASTWIQRQQGAIARRLAAGTDGERYAALLLTVVSQSDKLLECFETTKGQLSMQAAVYDMASTSLEPGPLGHAYLVPFRNRQERFTACTFIMGWKGMVQLALRSPQVREIDVEPVYPEDDFDWVRGTSPRIEHRPMYDGPPDFDRLTHVYAVCHTANGGAPFVVLSKQQILHYRSKSKQPDGFGWRDYPVEMGMKTAVRRGFARWPCRVVDALAVHRDLERENALDGQAEVLGDESTDPPKGRRRVQVNRAATAPTEPNPPTYEPPPPPSGAREPETMTAPPDAGGASMHSGGHGDQAHRPPTPVPDEGPTQEEIEALVNQREHR